MPPDLFADESSIPSLREIEDEVRAGLPGEADRMDCALANEDFYAMRQARHLEKHPDETPEDFAARPKRYRRFVRQVVDVLTEHLYSPGPTRTLGASAEADAWLQAAYAAAHVNAVMQAADRSATLNAVAAIQVEATGDPSRPIRLWLWKAHEFAVFTPGDDPTRPWAVVTKSIMPAGLGKQKTRYQAWSARERLTYCTEPYAEGRTAGGRRADVFIPEESGPSPYSGVLPFVFARNAPAISEFWEGGLGTALRECNQELDRGETELANHVQEFLHPRLFVRNVPTSARFLEKVGRFIRLMPGPGQREGDVPNQPDAFFLQPTLNVAAAREDMRGFADATLEELGVPATTVHADASTDLSGVAIVAKSLPLLARVKRRQAPFAETEEELAAAALAVAGVWHGRQGQADGARLVAAARAPRLVCVWPEPSFPLPTAERDAGDAAELDMGLTDPIEMLARRRGVTLGQAEEMAVQIAERRKRWNAIMGETAPALTGADPTPTPDPADPAEPGAADPEGE